MIIFYESPEEVFAVGVDKQLSNEDLDKLYWLFGRAERRDVAVLKGYFRGPRKEMVTPWSTNAVDITLNMGITGLERIEVFRPVSDGEAPFDPMLESLYQDLDQKLFLIDKSPESIRAIDNIAAYNEQEGLALSQEEVQYLQELSERIGRKLTDSEVFGFSQVNSEHCRHKIFNGRFIIDGQEMGESLFALIRKTSKMHPNRIVSAYKDNVAFVEGPVIEQFAPEKHNTGAFFQVRKRASVLSLKAETHNFPTTVEPFNGAATGTGGEIRDRMAGGRASMPLIGTAVYMTSYPRPDGSRAWERYAPARNWLYQTPEDILIKASNGASDFGNKFGQPLLCGSLLTLEYPGRTKMYGYDKVVMLAGGVGYGNSEESGKEQPQPGDIIVVLGGDNYRIGMGGGAVSSVATGEYGNRIELNAVQRSNPEMQKRVYNAIRALAEAGDNPIRSIHDHGAGGHLNCLSELVETTGGEIYLDQLPVGDPTLSAREIIGNESQERMGLIMAPEHISILRQIAARERAPMYEVGRITGDHSFRFINQKTGERPIDLTLEDFFGKPPITVLTDQTVVETFSPIDYDPNRYVQYLEQVLQIEAVACKDWLTNKVDRSVTGRGAVQQTAGEIQLPINDLAVVALDYQGRSGIATSIGHAPAVALVDPEAGSRMAVAEALTNLIWAPLVDGLKSVSLSANWMWPAKNSGENARLYRAVKALSNFCCELGINVPTGKDSMSMTQKYPSGEVVYSPGTVIISSIAEVTDIRKVVPQVMRPDVDTALLYIDFSDGSFNLGGSSLSQLLGTPGSEVPDSDKPSHFLKAFNAVQELIFNELIISGHDVSAGGLVTTLLEMCFPNRKGGVQLLGGAFPVHDPVRLLFSEQPSIVIQVKNIEAVETILQRDEITYYIAGKPIPERTLRIEWGDKKDVFDIDVLRDKWYHSSYLLDRKQSGPDLALERYGNYSKQPLEFRFPGSFSGLFSSVGIDLGVRRHKAVKAAIIREKGVNGDREMAYALYLAGFEVKDVHMTDLIAGREDLSDVNMMVFVGGFSNSDVLGSAKGWAGAFLYNPLAKKALENFYKRKDTLSLGVCNGCQLMMELDLIYPERKDHPKMHLNRSGKFESGFIGVDILPNRSVMLSSLAGSRLGVWVAHAEGRFELSESLDQYQVPLVFAYQDYPANPNGSPAGIAAMCSEDGRHLAMMPHLERAFLPWQWPHYPDGRKGDEMTPWLEAFANAREWIKNAR